MSVSVVCCKNTNAFSLDLKLTSELLSVTVFGREFQVAGTESMLSKVCAEAVQWSWRLRYAGINMVRILYVSTANLYVIRC